MHRDVFKAGQYAVRCFNKLSNIDRSSAFSLRLPLQLLQPLPVAAAVASY
jgi:hypothetical protein